MIINEPQAKIVRRIFNDYLDRKGPNRIARELEEEHAPNWNGTAKWYEGSIRKMLSNEKYKGDALLQKTYTVDYLTKKRVENTGQVPRYYVEDNHPAIIDKDMWEAVQLEMERKKVFAENHGFKRVDYGTSDNPFAGKVICGDCSRPLAERFGTPMMIGLEGRYGDVTRSMLRKGKRAATTRTLKIKYSTKFLLMFLMPS
ncbi:recombinase family protein [Aquibacillus salsiterrae]|uniref:Recombinase family protein n=1 Tax=Aquibacillus salsiterrae TaxID=2950439 RepID=A0A9X3WFF4_9BACI|nr:recombinase family protein [Aquibacillus salsiterrae]MDC3418018.1 recombinase family protein [Aquibacillus salsiterrae]